VPGNQAQQRKRASDALRTRLRFIVHNVGIYLKTFCIVGINDALMQSHFIRRPGGGQQEET